MYLRPASCVRVRVSEIGPDGHIVRELVDVEGEAVLHHIPHS